MQSRRCSTTNSRRTSAIALGIALLLSPAAAAPAPAQSLELSAAAEGASLTASLSFRWAGEQEIAQSLRDGLESRITFTLRVYETRAGLLPLFRDTLRAEKTVSRSAYWDFLDGMFVIESSTESRVSFARPEDLLRSYFRLSSVPLYSLPAGRTAGFYVLARAQFEPVRLVPPLTIISLVGAAATHTTSWVRAEAGR